MCLSVPAQVIEIEQNPIGMPMGTIKIGDATQQVCLAYLPDVRAGDYVLCQFGFATARLEPDEAKSVLQSLNELDRLLQAEDML